MAIPDDPRLLRLIDAWLTLSDDSRNAIAKLAGFDHDYSGSAATTSAR
ncbi:MAG: hypothetical protein ACKV2Q_28065 [Planctomycetaceae bacterium]